MARDEEGEERTNGKANKDDERADKNAISQSERPSKRGSRCKGQCARGHEAHCAQRQDERQDNRARDDIVGKPRRQDIKTTVQTRLIVAARLAALVDNKSNEQHQQKDEERELQTILYKAGLGGRSVVIGR